MSTRIKVFSDERQARDTRQFLSTRGLKTYVCNRAKGGAHGSGPATGFDLFALRDEDVPEARQLLEYEFGTEWGENGD